MHKGGESENQHDDVLYLWRDSLGKSDGGLYRKKHNVKTMIVDFQVSLNSLSLSMQAQMGAPAVNGHMLRLGL